MKPIKIAMLSLTHGHTRKYFQVLSENPLLDWVGVQVSDSRAKEYFCPSCANIVPARLLPLCRYSLPAG